MGPQSYRSMRNTAVYIIPVRRARANEYFTCNTPAIIKQTEKRAKEATHILLNRADSPATLTPSPATLPFRQSPPLLPQPKSKMHPVGVKMA